jgi:hypothetical protein
MKILKKNKQKTASINTKANTTVNMTLMVSNASTFC